MKRFQSKREDDAYDCGALYYENGNTPEYNRRYINENIDAQGFSLLYFYGSFSFVICSFMASAVNTSITERTILLKQQIASLPADDYNSLNNTAIQQGYENVYELIDSFDTRSLTYADQSRIKDLDDNGSLTIADVIAFSRFLNGDYLYAYSYEELDVNGDYLLDSNDFNAYFQYFTVYSSFSSHGALQSVDYNFEHRSYTKYDYTTNLQST